jgi:hypothetical protein
MGESGPLAYVSQRMRSRFSLIGYASARPIRTNGAANHCATVAVLPMPVRWTGSGSLHFEQKRASGFRDGAVQRGQAIMGLHYLQGRI